jgi:hypothetical protein
MSETHIIAKRVGIMLCTASVLWLGAFCFWPLAEWLMNENRKTASIVGGALFVVIGLPGGLLAYLSWMLVRGEVTRPSIKNALGMFAGMAIFVAAFGVSYLYVRLGFPEMSGLGAIAALFASIVIGLPLNAYFTKRLMLASGLVAVPGEFVGRGSYLMLAYLLFFILSPVFLEIAPRFETDSLLDLGFIFMPILIPFVLYRLAVKFLVRDTIEAEVALNHPDWRSE